MGLSRRGFLGALLAATTAPAIVNASSLMPIYAPKPGILTLWGDGVHDDTLALQALIDGKCVDRREGAVFARKSDGSILLVAGSYALSSTISLPSKGAHSIQDCNFTMLGVRKTLVKWEQPKGPKRKVQGGYRFGI